MTNEPDLESFEDFSGQFIKVEFITAFPVCFIPLQVRGEYDDKDKAQLIYTGEIQGKKKDWSVNKTNMQIIKDFGIKKPKELIGKKVWFKQVMNYSPAAQKKVPSLEIEKVE